MAFWQGTVTAGSHPANSPPATELYDPKAFIAHAALLGQASAHCRKFPTAASRRSLGRVSVPMWPSTLSGRLRIIALVGRCPANQLMRRKPIRRRFSPLTEGACAPAAYPVLDPVSRAYPGPAGRLLTYYSPVRPWEKLASHSLPGRLACIRHAASVNPEPGSNSSFVLFSVFHASFLHYFFA